MTNSVDDKENSAYFSKVGPISKEAMSGDYVIDPEVMEHLPPKVRAEYQDLLQEFQWGHGPVAAPQSSDPTPPRNKGG